MLAGFWIATLILQLPLTSFLLFHSGIVILPLERAVDIVQITFILFEVIKILVMEGFDFISSFIDRCGICSTQKNCETSSSEVSSASVKQRNTERRNSIGNKK